MKRLILILIAVVFVLDSCKKQTIPEPAGRTVRFVPTDVLVKTKNTVTIDRVFDFINSYNHKVEYIYNSFYVSALPPDSLQFVLNYLNKKSYTNDGRGWGVSGYLNYQSQVITIMPRLYNMENRDHQADWLASIKLMKMTEVTDRKDVGGSIIFFHVPETEEKAWVERFRKLNFVEWAEQNSYADIYPHD
jgi:hypothetical protein